MAEGRYAATKMALTRRVGMSYWSLNKYFKLPDRRYDHQPGKVRYDVQAWHEFVQAKRIAHNFGTRDGRFVYQPNERERAIIEKNKIATQREKFKLEAEMAEYIPRVDANRQIESANYVVKRELHKALVMELPARLEMLKAAEIRKITQAKFDQIVAHLPGLILKALNGTGSNRS